MRIAYLSTPYYADVDLCFLEAATRAIDITYFLILTPLSCQATAINISKMLPKTGIFRASDYSSLKVFNRFVDDDHFYVVNLPHTKAWHPATIITYIKLFWLFIRHFDIIHTTTYYSYNNCFLYLLRNKTLLTMHDPFPHSNVKSKMALFDHNNALKYSRNFLLLNTAQLDPFKAIFKKDITQKNVYLSALSSYNYLRLFTTHKLIDGDYILFFGRICSYKGLEFLFPAMERLHITNPNVKLIVAGSGQFYFDYGKYSRLEYIEIRNRFIPDEELASLIKYSMFSVVPYKDATQSGVIMSAYAFYKPCIATNVGGLPEMVIDQVNGLIVPSCDSNALAAAMIKLVNSKETIVEYAARIRQDYEAGEKSWSSVVKGVNQIYERMITG